MSGYRDPEGPYTWWERVSSKTPLFQLTTYCAVAGAWLYRKYDNLRTPAPAFELPKAVLPPCQGDETTIEEVEE